MIKIMMMMMMMMMIMMMIIMMLMMMMVIMMRIIMMLMMMMAMSTCAGSADDHFLDWPGRGGCTDSLQGEGPAGHPSANHPLMYWARSPKCSNTGYIYNL